MAEIPSSDTVSPKLERIAKLAKQAPQMAFTSLSHHIDTDWLREAFRRTRKGGATGVDGQSAEEYATNLEGNLASLLDRAKSGTYRAPPVRRVHIPKGDGSKTRPIGIPTFEDKVLERAVAMVLGALYEQDFLDCSYGFRPGRSAHDALEAIQHQLVCMAGGWVLELDIKAYFDTVVHEHLREMLRRRVRDGVLLRLIGKWLNAGVMEDGFLSYLEAGTPQGGVVSPLLANIYLHEVLDVWFEQDVRPRLQGRAFLVRYADDAVIVFAREDDARRVLAVLPERMGKYGLSLHPDKTRLVEFRRPDRLLPSEGGGSGRSGSFVAVSRRAGCGSPARPDPWGPWESDLPGLPERVHVACTSGKGAPPVRSGARQVVIIRGWERDADAIGPDDLRRILGNVRRATSGHEACDISIGGPLVLGFWLGCALRNHFTALCVVHAQDRAVRPDEAVVRAMVHQRGMRQGVTTRPPPRKLHSWPSPPEQPSSRTPPRSNAPGARRRRTSWPRSSTAS